MKKTNCVLWGLVAVVLSALQMFGQLYAAEKEGAPAAEPNPMMTPFLWCVGIIIAVGVIRVILRLLRSMTYG